MRAVWKGVISFGLVTIPIRLYRATEERDLSFHQVRRSDGSRIKYKRVAAVDGEEVAFADIVKGYELASGETVVLTDDDLADLPLTTSRTVEVETFVPLDQVDPIYFDRSYYVEPEGQPALKPYALLRDALSESGRVAIVKVALRRREQIAALRVRDGVFVLETMLWPDEVREADFPFLTEEVRVRPQELAMAGSLIESLAGDFDPSQYTDAYREAVEAVVNAKIEGHEVVAPAGGEPNTGGEVLDLMAALRASVAAAKKARGEDAGGAEPAPTADADDPADDSPDDSADESAGSDSGAGATAPTADKKAAHARPADTSSADKSSAGKSSADTKSVGTKSVGTKPARKAAPRKATGGAKSSSATSVPAAAKKSPAKKAAAGKRSA